MNALKNINHHRNNQKKIKLMEIIYFILALIAGSLVPVLTSSNTVLSKNLSGVIPASLVMFIIATICCLITLLISKSTIPNINQFASSPVYSYFGGIISAIYIMMLAFLAPKLGIGNVTVLLVTGQAISIMIIEQLGLFDFPIRPINLYRIIGVVFLIFGVYLIKKF